MSPAQEEDDGYGALASCLLAWLVAELVFLGIIMVYLVPKMNKIEPPAEVRPPPARSQLWFASTSFCSRFSGDTNVLGRIHGFCLNTRNNYVTRILDARCRLVDTRV